MMEDNKDSAAKQQSKRTKTIDDSIETLIGETPNLPQDIIEEIMVRLPAKSLLKFRCVAKSWLSLISSPKFIKTHLRYSTLDPTSANYRLSLGISYDPVQDNVNYGSVSSAVCDLFADDVVDGSDSLNNMPTEYEFKITSSCNGLLCVSAHHHRDPNIQHYFLWNPCSRTSKKFPPVAALQSEQISSSTYGIGYDEPNDDYKIVGIFYCLRSVDVRVYDYVGLMYILKNDSWKKIEGFEGTTTASISDVIFASAKFHFLAYYEGDSFCRRWKIASLDLENEVYGITEQPKYDGFHTNLSIGVLNGCLSVLYSYARGHADCWVLKEYGVNESWTKLVSIPYVGGPNPRDDLFSYEMCALWNGKYLLVRHHQVVIYDPENNSFAYPRPRVGNLCTVTSTGIYAESLLPLPI